MAPDVPPTDNVTPEIKVRSESERSRARQAAEERAEKLSTRPGATADPTTLAKTRPGNEQPNLHSDLSSMPVRVTPHTANYSSP